MTTKELEDRCQVVFTRLFEKNAAHGEMGENGLQEPLHLELDAEEGKEVIPQIFIGENLKKEDFLVAEKFVLLCAEGFAQLHTKIYGPDEGFRRLKEVGDWASEMCGDIDDWVAFWPKGDKKQWL